MLLWKYIFCRSPGALTPYRCKPAGCVTKSRCALPGSLRHSGLPDALLPRGEAVGVRGLSVPLGRCLRRPVPDSGARWVSHNRGEADPLTSLTQVTAVWWGSIPPSGATAVLSGSCCPSPSAVCSALSAPHPGGLRARTAGRCPEYPPVPAVLAPGTHYSCCMRRLKEEGVGERKKCVKPPAANEPAWML